jgi:hypothetical protein
MDYQVDASLTNLLVDIEKLIPLPNNPRKGNLDAIIASYREFGQLKPIVVRPNEDGTMTVIAGNHQFQAAQKLGWTHIAAVQYEVDDNRAIAFALADNRTNELGYTDPSILKSLLGDIDEIYPELLEDLGWDMFEMASINEQINRIERTQENTIGYTAPVLIDPMQNSPKYAVEHTDEGSRLVPSQSVDDRKVAANGSTSIGAQGTRNAVVQYTLVFDNADQQGHWYAFVKWLRSDPSTDGDTIAEKLINFLDAHADYR